MKQQINLLLFIFLLGVFSTVRTLGVTVNDIFNKANKEYRNKDYPQAITDYLSIIKQNYRSPELYFNLGDCYYKTDSIGKAILFYEKAKRLSPSDKDIALNLQLANLKVTDKIEPINEFIIITWWHNFVRSSSADVWAIWAVVLLWLGLVGALLFFFGTSLQLRKAGFFTAFVFLVISAFLFVATFSRSHFDARDYAIITSPSVHIMSEPDEQSKELFVLHEGVKVKILSSSDNYKNVELPDGKQGWVEDDALGEI
jgi:tetratricopeptide (TPR) repeat protein